VSGVVVVRRQTLLSCTSLASKGRFGLAAIALPAPDQALAGNGTPLEAIATLVAFSRQEVALLMTSLALIGFSVVAAILLLRTRIRAARNETRLGTDIAELQLQADRYRALLFAEPQIL